MKKWEPHFVGVYDTIPETPDSKTEIFQQNYGFVTPEGYLVVMLAYISTTNGASIPGILWPILGHPLSKTNRRWSAAHDGIYNGTAVVIDLNKLSPTIPVGLVISNAHEFLKIARLEESKITRKWADLSVMKAAMRAVGDPSWKRSTCVAGVRWFAGHSWHRDECLVMQAAV